MTETYDSIGQLSQCVTKEAGQVITESFEYGFKMSETVEKMIWIKYAGFPMEFKSIVSQSFDYLGRANQTVTQTLFLTGTILETVIDTAGKRVTELAGKVVTETLNAAGTVTRRVTDTLDKAGNVTKRVVETFDSAGHEIMKVAESVGNAVNPFNW